MVAVFEQQSEESEELELRALEHMLAALCEHVARLVDAARAAERLETREARLQLAAFEERRRRAQSLLRADSREPCSIRLGNLEKAAEALDCSRVYFGAPSPSWSVLVR